MLLVGSPRNEEQNEAMMKSLRAAEVGQTHLLVAWESDAKEQCSVSLLLGNAVVRPPVAVQTTGVPGQQGVLRFEDLSPATVYVVKVETPEGEQQLAVQTLP